MGGGVLTFLVSIANAQVDMGADVTILYSTRPDTPDPAAVKSRFDERVKVLPPVSGDTILTRALRLRQALHSSPKMSRYSVVHLHSSVAGGVGRALAPISGRRLTVYTPHGFAFLREDKSRLNRKITLEVERNLSRKGVLLVTSASELEIAEKRLGANRVAFLQSGVPTASMKKPNRKHFDTQTLPQVMMFGRLVYQKAPWRFAHVAKQLDGLAKFIWVGADSNSPEYDWLRGAPVEVIPWVSPVQMETLLEQCDVILFPSLWEGMALSLAQAQGQGIPCVVSDVPGNRDAIVDRVTGMICRTDEELVKAVKELIVDPHLRGTMASAAYEHARIRLSDDRIGADSLEIYERFI